MLGALPTDPQWPLAELPDPRALPLSPLQISDYAPDTRRVYFIFQVLESYNEKSLS